MLETFKNLFRKDKFLCFNCSSSLSFFKKSSKIYIRYADDQVLEKQICSKCADQLEKLKK